MKITDLTFTEIEIPQPVTRVVSLVPSVTETLFALGKGDTLIGRTVFCIEPKGEVERVPAFGGTKSPQLSDVLYIEAIQLPEGEGLSLTGQLGGVMQESARAARNYIISHGGDL